jgi:hypothetical protein
MEHDKEGGRKSKTAEVPSLIMSNEKIVGSKKLG